MVDQLWPRYLAKLATKLKTFYNAQQQEQDASVTLTATQTAKNQLDGFMEASLISQLMNKADLRKTVDEAHFDVFKMSLNERSKQLSEETDAELDWSLYDEPTIFRKVD